MLLSNYMKHCVSNLNFPYSATQETDDLTIPKIHLWTSWEPILCILRISPAISLVPYMPSAAIGATNAGVLEVSAQ